MTVSIYCLKRSDTALVFYVGQTSLQLDVRGAQHLLDRKSAAKYEFIQSLVSNGLNTTIELLEEVEEQCAYASERKWIKFFIDKGCQLLNANALPASPESEALRNWLLKNDLIVINRLEERAGIPQRVLAKALKGDRPLPDKYVKPLVKILKQYGYK